MNIGFDINDDLPNQHPGGEDDDLESGADPDNDYMTHNGINDDPETDADRPNPNEEADANHDDPDMEDEKGMLDGPANDLVAQPDGE